MIPLYSSLEISSIEVFSDATPTRKNGRENYSSVNRRKKGSKATSIRLFDTESVLGSIFATLFSSSGTFPLEESFSSPAGIRPSVGSTSRNAFVYAT